MKIIQPLEINGMKFEASIESKDVETHSRMQILNELDNISIKNKLLNIIELIVIRINTHSNKK